MKLNKTSAAFLAAGLTAGLVVGATVGGYAGHTHGIQEGDKNLSKIMNTLIILQNDTRPGEGIVVKASPNVDANTTCRSVAAYPGRKDTSMVMMPEADMKACETSLKTTGAFTPKSMVVPLWLNRNY